MTEIRTPNAIFDVAWSETTPDVLAAACGDGIVRVIFLDNWFF